MRTVGPSAIEGVVAAPPSKSVSVRAVAAACLAEGTTELRRLSRCDDALAALRVAAGLGVAGAGGHGPEPGAAELAAGAVASVPGAFPGPVRLDGRGARGSGAATATEGAGGGRRVLDCGESALCLRLFAPIAALQGTPVALSGRGSLQRRPVAMVARALGALGLRCQSDGGRPALELDGLLRSGRLELDGSTTSQLLSGLLMALPACDGDSELRVPELRSVGYAELTLAVMRDFGVRVERDEAMTRFAIPGGQVYRPGPFTVEGDYSGAAFLLVAGAIAGRVEVTGLARDSRQPDRQVLDALIRAGATVRRAGDGVVVERGELGAFELDGTDCPDAIPPLAALACHCRGVSVLGGAGRLRHKESDRAQALITELGRLGGRLELDDGRLLVRGAPLAGATVEAHGDHRIAMACAVAALGAAGPVSIRGAACVAKSYPGFFADLSALGAAVH